MGSLLRPTVHKCRVYWFSSLLASKTRPLGGLNPRDRKGVMHDCSRCYQIIAHVKLMRDTNIKGGVVKNFALLFLLGTSTIGYSDVRVPETVSFFATVSTSTCDDSDKAITCSGHILSEENISIVLDKCSLNDGLETCGGWQDIESSHDGITVVTSYFVAKWPGISDIPPRYTLSVRVGGREVTIWFGEQGKLTDDVSMWGDKFEANGTTYTPHILVGPVRDWSADD